MRNRWPIWCDVPELAVDCAHALREVDASAEPQVVDAPVNAACDARGRGAAGAVALSTPPSMELLIRLASAGREAAPPALIAVLGASPEALAARELGSDLGLIAVDEIRPLVSALALCQAQPSAPEAVSTRALPAVDRARLAGFGGTTSRSPTGVLTRQHEGRLGVAPSRGDESACVGEPRDVACALSALHGAEGTFRPPMPRVEDVDPQSVVDVIFGPARALSDPASKSALAIYDLPLPVEELCASPSRAAAEAGRIGFPVRIAVASPELRTRDHPDLIADGVDNAARVRDVFRQIMALARSRAPDARLLGVTVAATTPARCLLHVRATPLPEGLVQASIGFADSHGVASRDRTHTILPATQARLEQVLGRLRGSALLLEAHAAERKQVVGEIAEVLLRLAAFVHDWRAEVEAVELDPLTLRVGGGVEVREACVVVGDRFERSLEVPASSR